MKIKKMIEELEKVRAIVGDDAEVPVMRSDFGENDFVIPDYAVVADLEDQDGNEFKCALIGEVGGEELTKKGTPHYKWNSKKDRVK